MREQVCGRARRALKLCVHAHREHGHRAAVAVVRRVGDPLVVEAHVREVQHRERIVRLDDLFSPRVRQAAIAHEQAQTTGVQIALAIGGYAVENAGDAQRVVAAAPARAGKRQSAAERAVDIREFVGFDVARSLAGANTPRSGAICCSMSRLAPSRLR